MDEVILKRFETPDETRVVEKGKLEIVRIGGMTIAHDSWVIGDEPYVSIHFLGADQYAS